MNLIDSSSFYTYSNYTSNMSSTSSVSADKLQESLTNTSLENSTDEELMNVCKSFEAYFIEQVYKGMKNIVKSDDDQNAYMQCFGDILTQSYAENATEAGGIGLAQMLYESMKRSGY